MCLDRAQICKEKHLFIPYYIFYRCQLYFSHLLCSSLSNAGTLTCQFSLSPTLGYLIFLWSWVIVFFLFCLAKGHRHRWQLWSYSEPFSTAERLSWHYQCEHLVNTPEGNNCLPILSLLLLSGISTYFSLFSEAVEGRELLPGAGWSLWGTYRSLQGQEKGSSHQHLARQREDAL